jgi:hypothetical protein
VDAAERRRRAGRAGRRVRAQHRHEACRATEELSPAYVFLAAPVCSGYITGIVLPVTGSVEAI